MTSEVEMPELSSQILEKGERGCLNRYMRLENYLNDYILQQDRLLTKVYGNASEFYLVVLFHNPGIKT